MIIKNKMLVAPSYIFEENIKPEKTKCNYKSTKYYIYNQIEFSKSIFYKQGWKIHVSCTYTNYKEILNKVHAVCMQHGISYKYIYNINNLLKALSGDEPIESFGKFITIFANDNKTLKLLIENLYNELQYFTGPSILTDLRYKDSKIIFYRYGEIDGHSGFIFDNDGNKILDDRRSFELPYFIKDPFSKTNQKYLKKEKNNIIGSEVLPKKILRESSSGNVYLANYKNTEIILKEARKFVLDGHAYSTESLQNEINFLNTCLNEIENVPKIIKSFYQWDNLYVIENKISGNRWDVARSINKYNDEMSLRLIFRNTLNLVKSIHKSGICLNDISPSNFIIDSNLDVYFVDFGSSFKLSELKDNITGSTKGYYDNKVHDLNNIQSDYHKIGYLFMNSISSSNLLVILDESGKSSRNQFYKVIKDSKYPSYFSKIVSHLIDQKKGWEDLIINEVNKWK